MTVVPVPAPESPARPATTAAGTAADGASFSRVTVLAPRTRVDVALPADVAVADLLPVLLAMAGEAGSAGADGGTRHGGWCLARTGQAPLDPSRTLAGHGVLDGDLLALRRGADAAPAPLFDDVIDAVALSAPDSFRPWTRATARAVGAGTAVAALLTAAVALLLAGPSPAAGVAGGLAALGCVAVGAVLSRVYRDPGAATVLAAGGLPLALVSGLYLVPDGPGRANLLLACVAVVAVAAASVGLLGTGVTVFTAAAAAGAVGAGASLVAVLVAHPVPGIGAGMAAVSLLGLSAAPRLTIQLARMPLPAVPSTARELDAGDDEDFADVATIERQAALGHDYLSGLVLGFSAAAAAGALLAAPHGPTGVVLAVLVAGVLALRARTYANGVQAVSLLLAGVGTAAALLVGWMLAAPAQTQLLGVFLTCLGTAALALVIGVVVPQHRFSPPLRRSVEILEAVGIAAVLPVALGVMDLYATVRGL